MTYNAFDQTKPDATTQTLTQMGTSERSNLNALRDMIAANGIATGFNASIGAGAQPEVTQWLYKRGTEWIKVNVTWTSGRVTKCAYYYSSNSGGAYDPMVDLSGNYVLTLTYDGSGYLSSSSWGATP